MCGLWNCKGIGGGVRERGDEERKRERVRKLSKLFGYKVKVVVESDGLFQDL